MSQWMRRLFRLALLAYPQDFREHYRASMNEHFEEEGTGWRAAARTIGDVFGTAITMRAENLRRDVVYAVRMNAKAPLFTFVIIGAITLSIAANTTVFALLDAVLLKPLPYAHPQQIGLLWQRMQHGREQTFQTLATSQVDAVARSSAAFASVTASMGQDTITSEGAPLKRTPVLRNYFSTLGVRPALGRFLTTDSSARDVVISHELWRKRYGEDENVLGKRLPIDGQLYTIAGVAPAGMLDPVYGNLAPSDVWTILPRAHGGNEFAVFPIVRLKSGVSWQAAQADLARIQRNLKGSIAALPGADLFTGPLAAVIFANAGGFLWMVFAAVTGVLLIACANVANLLLVRASMRQGEFAVRNAIGASKRRIASQVLTEALLLAASGAVFGVILAWAALPWAKSIVPGNIPRLQSAHVDSTVLFYVCGLLVAVTLLTGMIPAYRPHQERGRDAAARVRAALVIVEVAVAFALTTGFGLVLHSFVSLTSVHLGFSPRGVYAAMVVHDDNMMFSPRLTPVNAQGVRSMVEQIRAIPGVEDASVATSVPFQNAFSMSLLLPKGWNGNGQSTPSMPLNAVQVGQTYFRLMRIPLLAGRGFDSDDFAGKSSSIIVNKAFARAYFPNRNPIGKTIRYSDSPANLWHVIGVVGSTRSSLKQVPQPLVYLPYNGGFGPFYGFAIRTSKEVPGLTTQISAILRHEQRGSGTVVVTSLEDLIAKDASTTRTSLDLLGALAAIALLLGLTGVYSVVAYGTERRFHEIGIRMAVGARPRDIVALVLRSTVAQGIAGVAAGVLLCAFTAGLLQSALFDTSPFDGRTMLAVAALLVMCTASAALIPACRAAFARPVQSLRYE